MSGAPSQQFNRPNVIERAFNALFGLMVGLGLGRAYHYLLQVRGRKSGKLYSAPVYLLVIDDRRYLVCPRGRSQWVRNAEMVGRVILKRGSAQDEFNVRAVPDTEKPEILKTYLERFKTIVQRYFPVPAGSPASAFAAYVGRYPVFELMASDRQNGAAT
jgi:deazaflavin-dependent oxidoreductase (nitroreductase family)